MKRQPIVLVLALLLASPSLSAHAEDALPPKVAPAPGVSLEAALRAATPPKQGLVLAVDAAKVSLPKDAVRPGDTLKAWEVGSLYGQSVQHFGDVTAIVPPTMTVVYSPPAVPNPYDGMPPDQAMKLLTQTFTPAQWKAFLSRAGVAYTDMQDGTQKTLFQALFPDGHLEIGGFDRDAPKDKTVSGEQLTQAHLRVSYLVSLALPTTDQPDTHTFAAGGRSKDAPPRYYMANSNSSDADRELGAAVRETLPNAPKPGDMIFDDPALRVLVPLGGLKTVDELTARIGLMTRREIYADARYGPRPVTLAGPAPSVPASDLLRALALCVRGTYRQVGPTWVLTDDRVGLGTRHAQWKEFEARGQALLPGSEGLFSHEIHLGGPPEPEPAFTVRDISFGDDPLALTDAQQKAYWKKWADNPEQGGSGMMDVTVPFDQLSSAQQEAAARIQQEDAKMKIDVTLDGTVMVQAEPEVEIVLPGLDGPVLIFQSYKNLLPSPNLSPEQQKVIAERMQMTLPEPASAAAPAPKQDIPRPDIPKLLAAFPRRAARVPLPGKEQTEKEQAREFAALHALGFNEVWLQIVPGTPNTDKDMLRRVREAVALGKKSGLTVYPALSLLRWQPSAAPDLLDRDILGRTASEAAAQQPFPHAPVSDTQTPFAPAVVQRMSALIRQLGSMPGIGGMVWENSVPEGYASFGDRDYESSGGNPLGYAEAGRLAFLRLAHVDPVDLYTNTYTDIRAHVDVPDFNSNFQQERDLYTKWRKMRAGGREAFLGQMVRGLPAPFTNSASRRPLLLPPSNSTYASSYGSWDDLHGAPPIVEFISPNGPDGQPLMGVAMTERMKSALVYTQAQIFAPPNILADSWKRIAAVALTQAAKSGQKNIILDMTEQVTHLDDLLPTPAAAPASQEKTPSEGKP